MNNSNPNILMIMTDQQRFDSLGCTGCGAIQTPHLDKLAAEGALFENCYVNNPICTPSRASIFTGKSLIGHGVFRVHDILPSDEVLFTQRLREQGYQTALFGKLHVSGRSFERDRRNPGDGFDIYEYSIAPHALGGTYNAYEAWLRENHPAFYERLCRQGRNVGFFPEEVHFTKWAADRTIDFIKNRAPDTPFFCCMSVVDPHDPYTDYPPGMDKQVDTRKLRPLIEPSAPRPDAVENESRHGLLGAFDRYSPDDILKMRIGYYASIAFLDRQVGRVLRELDSRGIENDTLVLFVSDHGDMLGDHGLLAKGAFFYDASVRVPLIIRYPRRIKEAVRVKRVVQPHHIAGTLLRAAGIDLDDSVTKAPVDLIETAVRENEANGVKGYAICEYRSTGINDRKRYWSPDVHATMIFDGRYKLSVFHTTNAAGTQGQLFDMQNDPDERNDLWSKPEYADCRQELLCGLLCRMVDQNVLYHGSRGGEYFPPADQTCTNNPL